MTSVRSLFTRAVAALMLGACVLLTPARAQTPPTSTLAPPASAYSSAVAYEWFYLVSQLLQQTPGNSPPVAARTLAYLGLTLYESVVPGMPGHQSLAGQLNELSSLPWAQPDEPLHWPTVANASMATMTRMMFSNASAENKGRIDLLERSLPLKYPDDFDPGTITADITNRSETFGKLMAMAIMTWARTDGGHEAWGPLRRTRANYVPPSGPGNWTATPSRYLPPLLSWWGEVRPFVLKSAQDCVPPPHPPFAEESDSPFYRAAKEVFDISNAATQEQRQFALYWADDPGKTPTPAGHWSYIANDLLRTQKADLGRAASTHVLLNMAMSDAFVAGWAAKYRYNLIRPVTYIQLFIDSNWVTPLFTTPNFPEYPSGHSVQSSAAAGVLEQQFGKDLKFVDNTHNDRGWGPRTFPSFSAAANEASISRMYAGIHFRFGSEGGQAQGRCVADKVMGLRLQP
jgi:hypothetical protein